ncbi:hypothetical protein [Thermococcus gorgonarius]|uniref:DUF4203 domain-containing protein n=1 Tax=Thermococcus gorgonarius TaxID=71997 RepID=A0A2Z2M4H4_THEGO|nr:hypothetical protein [Thermococcus gorgonarius]ASJ00787.1 hypothetical protein A3K92_04465 [Thermococcus gorgonarius]
MEGRELGFKFLTGAGVGGFLAFLFVIAFFPISISPWFSVTVLIAGSVAGGAVFILIKKNFVSSSISYLSGLGTSFAIVLTSLLGVDRVTTLAFAFMAVSLVPLYVFKPVSLLDAVLVVVDYPGGMITVLGLAGASGMLTLEAGFMIPFIALIGAFSALTIAVVLYLLHVKVSNIKPNLKP